MPSTAHHHGHRRGACSATTASVAVIAAVVVVAGCTSLDAVDARVADAFPVQAPRVLEAHEPLGAHLAGSDGNIAVALADGRAVSVRERGAVRDAGRAEKNVARFQKDDGAAGYWQAIDGG